MSKADGSQYGRLAYWDQRYTDDKEPFEWYCNYNSIREHCHEHFRPHGKILNVGCGNSRVSEDMHFDGFKDIVNVDLSGVVIQQMIDKTQSLNGLSWQVMDARYMELDDESFDAVLDKGMIDTLLSGDNSVESANKFCSHVARILKPGGIYMCLSSGIPNERMTMLSNQDYSWEVHYFPVPKPVISEVEPKFNPTEEPTSCYWLYTCKTGGDDEEG
ncbi:hypothetical protein TrVE_jg7054 [Triparma verrucosa]|uniref:Methyltransferase type 11 domain-containing protein n=3 Tax=Triparma TaxID=722752 RepID=A0A9W7BQC9_9STRA|nr:hypothetical protein TrVE_jg7054 [Triparma verrucosa]GMH90758.1 hypothetical protein TrST_g5471 [Triparma strigata]